MLSWLTKRRRHQPMADALGSVALSLNCGIGSGAGPIVPLPWLRRVESSVRWKAEIAHRPTTTGRLKSTRSPGFRRRMRRG